MKKTTKCSFVVSNRKYDLNQWRHISLQEESINIIDTNNHPYKSINIMKFQSTSRGVFFFLKYNEVSLKFTWRNKSSALNKILKQRETCMTVIKMHYKNAAIKIVWFGSISSNCEMVFLELNLPSGNNYILWTKYLKKKTILKMISLKSEKIMNPELYIQKKVSFKRGK